MKKHNLILTVAMAAHLAFTCAKSPKSPVITMQVSETHSKLFQDLDEDSYAASDAEPRLKMLATKSDQYCEKAAHGKHESSNFLRSTVDTALKSDWHNGHYYSTLLGCRNWYTMTDLTPERDFVNINVSQNPKAIQKFDCYSVGFLQPYKMAASLNCSRLTIIDADFRILKAHLDFLNLVKSGSWATVDELMQQIRFSYPAGHASKKHKAEISLSMAELCGQNNDRVCLHHLIRFIERMPAISEINLILSPLHDFSLPAAVDDLTTVFYSSNAFDPHFTSEAQFKQFMGKLRPLPEHRERLLIYHQSEERNFGVYQLTNEKTVTTLCADRFVNVVEGKYSPDRCRYFPGKTSVYENYFDHLSKTRKVSKCSG